MNGIENGSKRARARNIKTGQTGSAELIQGIVKERVRRCRPSCGIKARCAFRSTTGGRPAKHPGPCGRELALYRRTVARLTAGTDEVGIEESAVDAAYVNLLIDRCLIYLSENGLFYEDRKRETETCLDGERDASPIKVQMQPAVDQLMRLFERKHKLIDACMSRRAATVDRPREDISLAEFMKAVIEVGRKDVYDGFRCDEDSKELAESWVLPGDSRSGRRDV